MTENIIAGVATTYTVELPSQATYSSSIGHNAHCTFYVTGNIMTI